MDKKPRWRFKDKYKNPWTEDLSPGLLDDALVICPPDVCQVSLAMSVSKHSMTAVAARSAENFFDTAGYGPHSHHGPGTTAFSLREAALLAAFSDRDVCGDLEALFTRRERLIIVGASAAPITVTPTGVTLNPALLASATDIHAH